MYKLTLAEVQNALKAGRGSNLPKMSARYEHDAWSLLSEYRKTDEKSYPKLMTDLMTMWKAKTPQADLKAFIAKIRELHPIPPKGNPKEEVLAFLITRDHHWLQCASLQYLPAKILETLLLIIDIPDSAECTAAFNPTAHLDHWVKFQRLVHSGQEGDYAAAYPHLVSAISSCAPIPSWLPYLNRYLTSLQTYLICINQDTKRVDVAIETLSGIDGWDASIEDGLNAVAAFSAKTLDLRVKLNERYPSDNDVDHKTPLTPVLSPSPSPSSPPPLEDIPGHPSGVTVTITQVNQITEDDLEESDGEQEPVPWSELELTYQDGNEYVADWNDWNGQDGQADWNDWYDQDDW